MVRKFRTLIIDKSGMKILFLLLILITACGKEPGRKSSEVRQNTSAIFSANKIVVKVYYEEGAEPYTEGPLIKYWSIFQQNINALFQNRAHVPTLIVPMTLAEMTKVESFNKSTWSIDDVLSTAKTVETANPAGTITFSLFFLKGEASENSGILGFHINRTYTMAIFKDVIRNSGSGLVPIYVEQATVIHEMGHALGLVNNGVSMRSAHQDTENGAHCTNPKCVMYWQNEGTTGLKNFAANIIANGNTVMFDSQCLQDTHAY